MTDTAPTLTSVNFSKASYAKGEQMIVTAVGTDPDEEIVEVTVTLRSKTSGATSEPKTATAIVDELEAVATSPQRTFTSTGRAGSAFSFTTTA